MFARLEQSLRRSRKPGDKELAQKIAKSLKKRGEDIYPKEPRGEITRFSEQTRKDLESAGFVIYTSTGQTIETLLKLKRPIKVEDGLLSSGLFQLPSRSSEIAVNPYQLFHANGSNKLRYFQKDIIADASERIAEDFPGARVIMGTVADYVEFFSDLHQAPDELPDELLEMRDEYSFYTNRHVRTATESGSVSATVGWIRPEDGLVVREASFDKRAENLGIVPLIVPAGV